MAPVVDQPLEGARNLRLSPDGRRLALTVGPSGHGDLWVYDLSGGSQPLKLTFQDHNTFPTWSSDGKRIAFISIANSGVHMFSIPSDGSVLKPERLTTGDAVEVPAASSPDGAYLLCHRDDDLWLLELSSGKTRPWVQTPFAESGGNFSPNGRWVAHASNQTGSMEIWVRPFPGPGAPVRISSDGGYDPVWSRDGTELFYENGAKLMTARVVSETPAFRADRPRLLFEGGFTHDDTDPNIRYFDAAADGRLVMIESTAAAKPASIIVVQHWDRELNRLMSAQ